MPALLRTTNNSLKVDVGELLRRIGIKEGAKVALRETSELLRDETKKTLDQPGTGIVYTQILRTITLASGKKAVVPVALRDTPHRAAAPGEPPAKDKGDLQRSIGIDDSDPLRLKVGSDDEAATIMEFGLPRGRHPAGIEILPRPFFRATFDRLSASKDLSLRFIRSMNAQTQKRQPSGRFATGRLF